MIASVPIVLNAPLWLLVLPLPWLVPLLRPHLRRNGSRDLGQFIAPALQPWVIRGQIAPKRAAILSGVAWCLLVLALSGPALRQASPQTLPPAFDLAIVIDISPSMAADDLAPNRLARLKLELRDFLRLAPPFRGALVVYSSEAYRLLPLTRDRAVLSHYIDALDLGMTRRRGSNLGQGIEIARDTLAQSASSGGILLLTDGESFAQTDVEAMAKRLGAAHRPIYILGIGTTSGAPVPDGMGGLLMDDRGQALISHLDRTFLRRLAQASGGAYNDLSPDDADWNVLLDAIRSRLHPYQNDDRVQGDLPLFPYLIGATCLLLLWQGFRGPIPALCLLIILIPIRPAAASDETRAYQAIKTGDWQDAIRDYRGTRSFSGLMGLGFAQFRAGLLDQARIAFASALPQANTDSDRALAAYNLGTTEARLKSWKAARTALNKAIRYRPDYPEARQNLRLVEQAMRTNHAGLRASETAKSTRTDLKRGQLDLNRTPVKIEENTHQKLERSPSPPAHLSQALKQWGLDTTTQTPRENRTEDDIRSVVRYRIARQENARPPLELGMPPW